LVRTNVPDAIRVLRRERGWRQEDLGHRASLSRDTVSRAERGKLDGLTLGVLSRLAAALDASLVVDVRWHGAELDRLIDRAHAALQNAAATRLGRAGWIARPEVSFNHYGDRGRCDLLAWHPSTGSLLIVEVKSRIADVQDLLGRLDVKVRLGAMLAAQAGWGRPARVVPALVLNDDHKARAVLGRHQAIFGRYGLRGRRALSWLRAPADASGLIWFEEPDSDEVRVGEPDRLRISRRAG
jgi:transcriptional regulator with XRE-family HTH domain